VLRQQEFLGCDGSEPVANIEPQADRHWLSAPVTDAGSVSVWMRVAMPAPQSADTKPINQRSVFHRDAVTENAPPLSRG